jgi:hypothetical protein
MAPDPEKLAEEFTFSFSQWAAMYPLRPTRTSELASVGGPGLLVLWEQIRRTLLSSASITSVPTDVFALGLGESSRRDVTKIGGLPYRPKGLPWPELRESGPMTFLAQFRFSESQDLVGSLPGDVLLVFIAHRDLDFFGKDPTYFHFEWHSLGQTDLVDEVPSPEWKFVTCFGVRHRTVDFRDPDQCAQVLRPLVAHYFPDIDPNIVDGRVSSIIHLSGKLKIGGLPDQGNYCEGQGMTDGLRFLASIPTIFPRFSAPYRWINRPEPRPYEFPFPPEEMLEWPQEALWINLFLSPNGDVEARCAIFV